MILYHGTILQYALNICENGIDLTKSKNFLDFGKGFYTTSDYNMAKNMAFRVSLHKEKIMGVKKVFPTVISFEYEENVELNYKIFKQENIDWAKFVLANRLTTNIAHELGLTDNNYDFKYDIIMGGTADGNIATIASNLRYGRMKADEYILNLSDFLKENGSSYGTQIVFCTLKSLGCIKYKKCDII